MRFMKDQPKKYSLDPLESDDWETRFTKQVARNIARWRDERKMTTEQLASACNEVYGEPGRVKPSTLSGMFSGKRKSIGIAEIVVFGAALDVPPIELIYSLKSEELIEATPANKTSPQSAALAFAGVGDGSNDPALMESLIEFEVAQAAFSAELIFVLGVLGARGSEGLDGVPEVFLDRLRRRADRAHEALASALRDGLPASSLDVSPTLEILRAPDITQASIKQIYEFSPSKFDPYVDFLKQQFPRPDEDDETQPDSSGGEPADGTPENTDR